jgi:hypothetical protein
MFNLSDLSLPDHGSGSAGKILGSMAGLLVAQHQCGSAGTPAFAGATRVRIPVIASGGAGIPEHLLEVLSEGRADAALIASMVHYGTYTIREIKEFLQERQGNCMKFLYSEQA